jgi:hypothetical protein
MHGNDEEVQKMMNKSEYLYADGSLYKGEVDSNGLKTGFGKI